jgi:hypothetical protein
MPSDRFPDRLVQDAKSFFSLPLVNEPDNVASILFGKDRPEAEAWAVPVEGGNLADVPKCVASFDLKAAESRSRYDSDVTV